ncbi:hypothetical protein ACHAXT_009452 [Thalassiosira profunda]
MVNQLLLLAALLWGSAHLEADAFAAPPSHLARRGFRACVSRVYFAEGAAEEVAPEDYDLLPSEEESAPADRDESEIVRAAELKRQLYQLAASYDRGFGATPKARAEADDILSQLADLNPTPFAANGIDGEGGEVPLKAIWRMVWTSAFDVVSLGASPFAAPSAIYQDITNPPIATNIIDFIPRAQTFFPSSIAPPSLLRAEVSTRASSRNGKPNRVGLVFEGIKLRPIELLGQKVDNLPSLDIDFTWPRNLIERLADFVPGLDSLGLNQSDDADAPGYFDVEYLDEELLVIRQQAPGGVFALVKVDSCEP